MKKLRRNLLLVLCMTLILGTMAFPVSAAYKTIKGGNSRKAAPAFNLDTSYCATIKSTDNYVFFKFKTNKVHTYYLADVGNKSVSKPINVYLRGTDYKDAGSVRNNRNIVKSNGCLFEAEDKPLKRDSWYYLIIHNPNRGAGQVTFHVKSAKDPEGSLLSHAKTVKAGTTYSGTNDYVLDNDYFKFVPAATGKYKIYIRNVDNTSFIRGYLINGSKKKLGGQSHIGKGECKSITLTLTRGTAYYVHINNQSDSYRHFKYRIQIQKQ